MLGGPAVRTLEVRAAVQQGGELLGPLLLERRTAASAAVTAMSGAATFPATATDSMPDAFDGRVQKTSLTA